jgi:hypothetical protein
MKSSFLQRPNIGSCKWAWKFTKNFKIFTRVYWVFGLCPSSGILKIKIFQKLDLFPSSGEEMGDTYSTISVRD